MKKGKARGMSLSVPMEKDLLIQKTKVIRLLMMICWVTQKHSDLPMERSKLMGISTVILMDLHLLMDCLMLMVIMMHLHSRSARSKQTGKLMRMVIEKQKHLPTGSVMLKEILMRSD